MRLTSLFLAVPLLALGCATPRMTEADATYIGIPAPTAPAAALVFDPPITQYAPAMNLDRDARQASAYLGYESASTVGVVTFDDRQYYSDAYRGSGRGGSGYGGSRSSGYLDRQAYQQSVVVRSR